MELKTLLLCLNHQVKFNQPNLITTVRMKKNYFFFAGIVMLLLALIGFSDNLFFDVQQESNSDPKFIIHGLFFLAWFVIFVIQTGFIRNRNYKAHIALGSTGMLIGLGVVVSTFFVFAAVYEGWSKMPFYVKANRIFTTSFAIFVLLAYLNRKKAAKHKRFLLMGTLYVLGPILDRVPSKFGDYTFTQHIIFEVIVWNLFFITLFIYDWLTLRKIHPVSWLGCVWFYLVWLLSLYI